MARQKNDGAEQKERGNKGNGIGRRDAVIGANGFYEGKTAKEKNENGGR